MSLMFLLQDIYEAIGTSQPKRNLSEKKKEIEDAGESMNHSREAHEPLSGLEAIRKERSCL